MKKLILLFLLSSATSCTSLDSIRKSPACIVWKDQNFLGPYSTEVNETQASWNGSCHGTKWKCRTVNVLFDENKNVLFNETIIGKIEGINFNSSVKLELTDPNLDIIYTALRVYPELKEVYATFSGTDVNDQIVYHYNDKCSSDQAIIGGIALGMIAEIQKNT